jgi:hypothetical protein
MTADAFLRTLYYGDRAVTAIRLDGWRDVVRVTVDTLSRIRSDDGFWHFYTDEDIADAELVFTGVTEFSLVPPGPIPNDLLNSITATRVDEGGRWRFVLSIMAASSDGDRSCEVTMTIVAESIHVEDPRRPGQLIVE